MKFVIILQLIAYVSLFIAHVAVQDVRCPVSFSACVWVFGFSPQKGHEKTAQNSVPCITVHVFGVLSMRM